MLARVMTTLNGTLLRVVAFLDNAYIYDVEVRKIAQGPSSKFELMGGYAVSLLQELSDLLDFRVELITDPPNLAYNFKLAAQNYSVDMFASSFFLSQDHTKFADPTFVTSRSRVQVFLNHAFEGSTKDVLLAPFESSVWYYLAFSVLLFSAAFCFVAYYSERVEFSIAMLQIISVILTRDTALRVQSTSSRTVQLTASITVLLLMSAYSAKVFSIGTVKVDSFSTLAGLATSIYDVSYDRGYGNGSSLEYHAELESQNPVISAIHAKAAKSKFRYDTFEDAMKEVYSRPFAYIIDEETAYSATARGLGRLPCELGIGSIYFAEYQLCMFMRKGFEHRSAINSGILRLSETGALKNFASRWIPGRSIDSDTACTSIGFAKFAAVELRPLKIAFGIFIAGSLSAICFLLGEIWSWRRTCKKLRLF